MSAPVETKKAIAQAEALGLPVDGPVLIEANAGTGKTYTLVHVYVRLLLEKRLLPSQVLLLTFTKAATAELGVRLRQLLRIAWEMSAHPPSSNTAVDGATPELRKLLEQYNSAEDRDWLKWCLVSFDQAAIYTINGFCQRILQEHAHLCGSPMLEELEPDESGRVREWLADYWRQQEKELGEALIRLVQGVGITLEGSKPGSSNKILQDLVHVKLNKTDFADINVPTGLKLDTFRKTFESIQARWQSDKNMLANMIIEAGISRAGPVDTIISQMDAFFDSGDVSGAKLRYFNGRNKHTLTFKKGFDAGCYPTDSFFDDFGQVLEGIGPFVTAFQYKAYGFVRRKFDQTVRTQGRYRYSDQIDLLHKAVTGDDKDAKSLRKAIISQWPAVLLDEFQDTDLRQFEIFKSCYLTEERASPASGETDSNSPSLIMVGDPKQAIYGFRGADVFVYQEARALIEGRPDHHKRLLSLATNWRSTSELIEFVNRLFGHSSVADHSNDDGALPFILPGIDYQPSDAPAGAPQALDDPVIERPVVLWEMEQDQEKSTSIEDLVSNEIQRLLAGVHIPCPDQNKRKIRPDDITVLVATNAQAEKWYEYLLAAGVPATLWSEQSVFETAAAMELCDAMRAVLRPDMDHVRAVMLSSLADFSLAELSEESCRHWQEELIQYSARWPQKGMAVVLQDIWENGKLPRGREYVPWLQRIDGERRWTDFNHLIELLARQEAEGCRGEKLLQWLADNIARKGKGSGDSAIRRLQSDEKGVTVMTLHKSKGLQFPVVFMPQLEKLTAAAPPVLIKKHADTAICHYHERLDDGRFKAVTNWSGDESARQASLRENISERRRLLYVGMTRAERRLYLSYQPPKIKRGELVFAPYLAALKKDELQGLVETKMHQSGQQSHQVPTAEGEALAAGEALTARRFDKVDKLKQVLTVSSFSALVAGEEREPLFEVEEDARHGVAQPGVPEPDVHQRFLHFPKGVRAGNCFHQVMERCPVSDPDALADAVVEQAVRQHGFLETKKGANKQEVFPWVDCLRKKAVEVCKTPLDKSGLCLTKADDYSAEFEFLLPVGSLTEKQVHSWLKKHRGKNISPLQHGVVNGYLTGSIDLVFRHGSRYFIVDYKTNHLGFSADDYTPSALQAAIETHHYDLQYLLYTAALVKVLRQRFSDFDYEKHFGGVYYLFVRGMGLEPARDYAGIYHNKPDASVVQDILETMVK